MKVVVLVIMLAFDPSPIILQVSVPNMTACHAVRRAMPPVVEFQIENITYRIKVLETKCKRIRNKK